MQLLSLAAVLVKRSILGGLSSAEVGGLIHCDGEGRSFCVFSHWWKLGTRWRLLALRAGIINCRKLACVAYGLSDICARYLSAERAVAVAGAG